MALASVALETSVNRWAEPLRVTTPLPNAPLAAATIDPPRRPVPPVNDEAPPSRHVPGPSLTSVVRPEAGSPMPAEMLLKAVELPPSTSVRSPDPGIAIEAVPPSTRLPTP